MIIDEEVYLEHFGVKGMRWGVRKKYVPKDHRSSGKKDTPYIYKGEKQSEAAKKYESKAKANQTRINALKKSTGRNGVVQGENSSDKKTKGKDSTSKKTHAELTAAYAKTKLPIPSKEQQLKNIAESRKKFRNKFDGSDVSEKKGDANKKRWRPTGKQIAAAALGAAFVGATIYAVKSGKTDEIKKSAVQFRQKIGRPDRLTKQYSVDGEKIPNSKYKKLVSKSQAKAWGKDYLDDPTSFTQPPMSFPPGHTFYRISTHPESSFKGTTYCVNNIADYNRYVSGFTQELGGAKPFQVTFKATKEIKVPDLTTRLETMREVLEKDWGHANMSDARVMYQKECGGSWNSTLSRKYTEALKTKGFHAIIDDMDAGVIGHTPLVIIDPSAFGEKTSAPITEAMKKASLANLTEIPNRKPSSMFNPDLPSVDALSPIGKQMVSGKKNADGSYNVTSWIEPSSSAAVHSQIIENDYILAGQIFAADCIVREVIRS